MNVIDETEENLIRWGDVQVGRVVKTGDGRAIMKHIVNGNHRAVDLRKGVEFIIAYNEFVESVMVDLVIKPIGQLAIDQPISEKRQEEIIKALKSAGEDQKETGESFGWMHHTPWSDFITQVEYVKKMGHPVGHLNIHMKSGAVYQYKDIPLKFADLFQRNIIGEFSIGTFYNEEIKGVYESVKL